MSEFTCQKKLVIFRGHQLKNTLYLMSKFRAILENIAEFQPELSKDIAEAGFMAWLVKKLKVFFQLVIVANKFETS